MQLLDPPPPGDVPPAANLMFGRDISAPMRATVLLRNKSGEGYRQQSSQIRVHAEQMPTRPWRLSCSAIKLDGEPPGFGLSRRAQGSR